MTGLGVLIFVIIFLRRTRNYITKFQGDRSLFWKFVPLYIIVVYFVSSYSWYLIEEFVIIPVSLNQFLAYISPFEYRFHLIGIIAGLAWCVRHFFSHIKDVNMQLKWIDARFLATMRGMIFLGGFLLLGDTFIGQATEGSIHVSAFDPRSNVANYDKVVPLGLFLSIISLVLLFTSKVVRHLRPQLRGYGLVGWIIFLCSFAVLILFQEYTRHLVFKFLGKTRDINNIALLACAGFIFWKYVTTYSYFSKLK